MTTQTTDPAAFDVPPDDREAYDGIKDSRIAFDIAAYWRQRGATAEGAALLAHRLRLDLVEHDRETSARVEADMASFRHFHACFACEGGGGPLCRLCRRVREQVETETALATPTADGRDRREVVIQAVAEAEAQSRAIAAQNHAAVIEAMNRRRVLDGRPA